MKKFIYEIYENGEKLMRGGAFDIARAYRLQSNKISKYANAGSLVKDRFIIKKVDEVDFIYHPKEPTQQSEEEILEYFIKHLELYGNVAGRTHEDPSKYLDALRERGYQCVASKFREIQSDDMLLGEKPRKTSLGYILTRVK